MPDVRHTPTDDEARWDLEDQARLATPIGDPLPPDPLLTTAQTARALGVDVTTINRWARKGTLRPAMQAPGDKGARFFYASDVELLREQLAIEDTEQAGDGS